MAGAFLVREELTLARELYAAKGNEFTAMPHLLDRMVLGAVVDAAGALRAPCAHGGRIWNGYGTGSGADICAQEPRPTSD